MIVSLLYAIAGLVLLVAAGDILVRGAVRLATGLGISSMIIGLTVVAMGTSMPELLVGVNAVLAGVPDLALGNVVGSNIANVLLVVGLPALLQPVACCAPRLGRNLGVMLAATASLFVFGFVTGQVGRTEASILLAGFSAFILWSIRYALQSRDAEVDEMTEAAKHDPLIKAIAFVILGLIGLPLGADLLVDGAVDIARALHVSEAVIGLTLIALGTSLPELATALAAAWRGHLDVAIGNVIGSNIFNMLAILGGTAMVGAVPIPPEFMAFDIPVMLAASCILIPFIYRRHAVGRLTGVAMLLAYIAYILLLGDIHPSQNI